MTNAKRPLFELYRLSDAIAEAYEASEGEETPEIAAMESELDALGDQALEALAGFLRHCEHGQAAVKAEKKRLDAASKRIARAEAWAKKHVRRLLGDRTSATAGAFQIKTRKGSQSIDTSAASIDALSFTVPDAVQSEVVTKIIKGVISEALKSGDVTPEALATCGVAVVTGERSVSIK